MIANTPNAPTGASAHLLRAASEPAQFLVSPQLELLGSNMSADAILENGQCLSVSDGKVKAIKRGLDPAIRDLIGQASHKGYRTLLNTEGDCDDVTWVASAKILMTPEATGQSILITARPLVRSEPMSGREVSLIFGLTPAEARLAVELAAGHSLAEISESRGVHISTLRAQLRSIYGKVGVSKQSEFVSAIWRAAAV